MIMTNISPPITQQLTTVSHPYMFYLPWLSYTLISILGVKYVIQKMVTEKMAMLYGIQKHPTHMYTAYEVR